ncbi:uncharacterized protein PAC_12296 [Phialocephala subalpina]|uniref:AB hydrolase-1 domain-containing protein n=1 Tax=Phialocephala subalpina TaxID=576137 RepID=A0A1L7XBJ8_9HELO|nr:uncharacterized protein PAC_12296 [Phialocephala subalpina]
MAPYLIVSLLYVTSFFLPGVLTAPVCTEIVVPVSITANKASAVSGGYDIAGRYCKPEVHIASRQHTLQLLAHPATYERNYVSSECISCLPIIRENNECHFGIKMLIFRQWSGRGYPGFGLNDPEYSWVEYASQQGYPTFAFDRLGNGNSSHPNSVAAVQCPAQAAITHEIIRIARADQSPFPRSFQDIIVVGASMGSLNANYLNVNYPQDVNATILTAISKDWVSVIPGFTVTAGLVPAVGVNYAKYGSLDPGYLQASIQSGVAALLFHGPGQYYNTSFIAQDYNNRGPSRDSRAETIGLCERLTDGHVHEYSGLISKEGEMTLLSNLNFPIKI